MLALDIIRGKHSTGVGSMTQAYGQLPQFHVVKDSLNSIDFMDTKAFEELMRKKHLILMGHNRWATQGAIIPENAHPFNFPNVIGAHNGSLVTGWKSSLHDSLNRVVDSEAVYSELNHSSPETLWSKLNGPAALTWIDKKDGSLHFLRNKERPLWWTTMNKGQTIIWASEFWMIHVAAGREGGDLDEAPRELPVNTHLSFDISNKHNHVPTCKREVLSPYVAPKWEPVGGYKSYTKTYGYNDYDDGGEEWLRKEGVSIGDHVEFTVDSIRDYADQGVAKCAVHGKTLLGTKISCFNVITDQWDDLLLEMWEYQDMVFTAKIKYSTAYGLVFDITTANCVHFTMQEIKEAEEKQALDKEIKLLAASLGEDREKLH